MIQRFFGNLELGIVTWWNRTDLIKPIATLLHAALILMHQKVAVLCFCVALSFPNSPRRTINLVLTN